MVVEFHMPEQAHFALQGVYYFFAVITLVANLRCARASTLRIEPRRDSITFIHEGFESF